MEQIDHNPDATEAEQQLSELLTVLVMKFEENHYCFPPNMQASPLDVLKELMMASGLQQSDLVNIIGPSDIVSEVCNGKRSLSKTMALKLGNRFNVELGLFLDKLL